MTSPTAGFAAHGGKHVKRRGGGSSSAGVASVIEKLMESQQEDRETSTQRFQVMMAHIEEGVPSLLLPRASVASFK